jgi:8-oxo-dGTP diphosphatase
VSQAPIHVAAAVIAARDGRVLIARRPDHAHQGGLWEFPGGKREPGETVTGALDRELREELGIRPTASRPQLRVHHDYGDKRVLLDVWRVSAWNGEPHGREGQPLAWVPPDDLPRYPFPAANRPIVTAARLPDRYLITPEPGPDPEGFLAALEAALEAGLRLVQLRSKVLPLADLEALARAALGRCRRHGAQLILNGDPEHARAWGLAGVHLDGRRLAATMVRPLPEGYWVTASCHDRGQLEQAARAGADFVVCSPVLPTESHPGAGTLGWNGLRELTEAAPVPVYALGGLDAGHLETAWAHGAQGIAAIRGLWRPAPVGHWPVTKRP